MYVPAPQTVHHSGLHDVFNSFSQAIDTINKINQYTEVVTNPNSSNNDRLSAYFSFAALSKSLANVSGVVNTALDDVNAKLKTYLQSIDMTVTLSKRNQYTGETSSKTSPMLHTDSQGNRVGATLWDVINGINTNDTSNDFSVKDTAEYHWGMFINVPFKDSIPTMQGYDTSGSAPALSDLDNSLIKLWS